MSALTVEHHGLILGACRVEVNQGVHIVPTTKTSAPVQRFAGTFFQGPLSDRLDLDRQNGPPVALPECNQHHVQLFRLPEAS